MSVTNVRLAQRLRECGFQYPMRLIEGLNYPPPKVQGEDHESAYIVELTADLVSSNQLERFALVENLNVHLSEVRSIEKAGLIDADRIEAGVRQYLRRNLLEFFANLGGLEVGPKKAIDLFARYGVPISRTNLWKQTKSGKLAKANTVGRTRYRITDLLDYLSRHKAIMPNGASVAYLDIDSYPTLGVTKTSAMQLSNRLGLRSIMYNPGVSEAASAVSELGRLEPVPAVLCLNAQSIRVNNEAFNLIALCAKERCVSLMLIDPNCNETFFS